MRAAAGTRSRYRVAALLVALRVCRQRQALLLVDPPAPWSDAATAIEALRNWPLYSEDAVMFYPRYWPSTGCAAAMRCLVRPGLPRVCWHDWTAAVRCGGRRD